MAWIESHQSLGAHPKLFRLCTALGISQVCAVGHLHFLWWWAASYAKDGMLTGCTPLEVSKAAHWEGDPDAFLDAMIATHFIDRTAGKMDLHDWSEYRLYHDNALARREGRKEQVRENVRRFRSKKRGVAECNQDVITDVITCNHDVIKCNQHNHTIPNQTKPNQTIPNPLPGAPVESLVQQAEEVIQFLNEKTGRHYRAREGTNALSVNTTKIMARLKSGATVLQCRQVIAMKAREWRADEKMAKFLRPATLFGKEKFEQYLGELGQQEVTHDVS
jgi:uncharacterized phage protein (TIGR02220 family)